MQKENHGVLLCVAIFYLLGYALGKAVFILLAFSFSDVFWFALFGFIFNLPEFEYLFPHLEVLLAGLWILFGMSSLGFAYSSYHT